MDLGAHADIWGQPTIEPTCLSTNATHATRRDYIIVRSKEKINKLQSKRLREAHAKLAETQLMGKLKKRPPLPFVAEEFLLDVPTLRDVPRGAQSQLAALTKGVCDALVAAAEGRVH